MKQSIQSFLDDLQIMPVCNSKRLADVLALAVEQPTLLETHRLFYRYAVSNDLYTSTVTAVVKRALCSAQNTALMETLTGTDGWDVHPERFLFCAVESLTGRRPKLRFQLRHAISEDDYDLLLHYKTQPQALSERLGLQPKSLGSRYQRARENAKKAVYAADAGAPDTYLLYWYNLCPERIAVLREFLEKQWQFHDYTSLQEPQRSICQLMDSLHLRPTHRGHAYMVYALSLSLENPSLLQSGEVWQKTAEHYQTPVSKITSTLSSFVQSIRATEALEKLIGVSIGYDRHYAKLAAAMHWRLTGRRITFRYHLSSVFMEEDIQMLKDLYAHPIPIAHYAKANGYDPSRLQHRISSLGSTLLALYNDMQRAPDLYLLYWYGLTEEQLPFLKQLAGQYAAYHTRSLGRFLYKRRRPAISLHLSYHEYVGESDT